MFLSLDPIRGLWVLILIFSFLSPERQVIAQSQSIARNGFYIGILIRSFYRMPIHTSRFPRGRRGLGAKTRFYLSSFRAPLPKKEITNPIRLTGATGPCVPEACHHCWVVPGQCGPVEKSRWSWICALCLNFILKACPSGCHFFGVCLNHFSKWRHNSFAVYMLKMHTFYFPNLQMQ